MAPRLLVEESITTTVTKKISYRLVGEPSRATARVRRRKKTEPRKKR